MKLGTCSPDRTVIQDFDLESSYKGREDQYGVAIELKQTGAKACGPRAASCGCGLLIHRQLSDHGKGSSSHRGPMLPGGLGSHSWKLSLESLFSALPVGP